MAWLFILDAVLIIIGNIFTIVIFTKSAQLRRRRYSPIVSLAVADLMVGLVSIPFHLSGFYRRKTWVHQIAYLVEENFFATASLYGLTLIAVERAFATCFPIKHRNVDNIPYILGISFVWLFSAAISVSSVIANKFTLLKGVTVAIALFIMTVAYLVIVLQINCRVALPNQTINRSSKKLTVTLGIVTIISLITLLPYHAVVLYVVIGKYYPQTVTFFWIRHTAKFLYYTNSLANPIVYAFRMREFKREIFRRLHCLSGNVVFPSDGIELGNLGTTSGR